jgi:proteasome beta subunit
VAIEAIFQAADEDIATGGPDIVRGIYPVVALITADGFERLDDDDVAARTGSLLERLRGAS